MKHFKQLLIWQKGIQIALLSYKLVTLFPKNERFGLSSQITRAASSIPSNIAEGSSRSSEKDYRRFLEIALGSLYELETHLTLSNELDFGEEGLRNSLMKFIVEEQRMLIGFMKTLNG
ncbi:MAG TPA: four helix bundle protein [Chitinophagaceae bacterium]|jgi:four helix bundle protein|nr:four helix bundle protein [Chitinophagaceae bacterium]